MELEESTFLTSDNTTKLQSSRQYDTVTKPEIWITGIRQKAQEYIHAPIISILSFKKEVKIHNGEKTVSPINSAGKTGQLHVKE